MPFGPTCEPLGHADGPSLASLSASHFLKSFRLKVTSLGAVIFSVEAVCVVAVFLTVNTSLVAFGFLVVPALLGVRLTSTVEVGAWATATLAVLNASVATAATRKGLRKDYSSESVVRSILDWARASFTAPQTPNNTSTSKRFRC